MRDLCYRALGFEGSWDLVKEAYILTGNFSKC